MLQVIDTLKRSQLNITDSRKKILQLFMESDGALAHMDIESSIGDDFDRVTIYRTLQIFVEKGILHTIPSPDNSIRYALCRESCSGGTHQDNHIHFLCDVCGMTYCLDHLPVPAIRLPKGFSTNRTDVLASGVCNKCSTLSKK
ncbi:MAG: Fur family transcriptional regulator [Sediminibacterium sp.]